ncbi:sugar transporter [Rhodobacteraceae bacterium DSL-40]|uniref:sugar transporter n=1 Tax=Amaricoccus sp. B4 TaxID=3368557 RepID=UPI0013A6DD10
MKRGTAPAGNDAGKTAPAIGEAASSAPSARQKAQIRRTKRQLRQKKARRGGIAPAAVTSEIPQKAIDVPLARPRGRHRVLIASFVFIVLLPAIAATAYLHLRAADQYHSVTDFSIRSEEQGSAAAGLLGAITQINTGTASDADIIFEYIRSQKMVEDIDAQLDLRRIYNKAEGDPVFTLDRNATIERLLDYWNRMVEVSYEASTGIIHVRANAFTPEDARAIAAAILAESGKVVNQLSEQARDDAVRFARDELAEAEAHLREVRKRMADFRRTNRIVDPSADIAGQMGLLNALQQELAQALVDRDVLLSYAAEDDQRVIQANRRISAITDQIETERTNLGVGGKEGEVPEIVGTYEELLVDTEFANTAYTQTLAALAAARAEARRQSRYLAPHVRPTLAESSLYPRRNLLSGLVTLFLLLGWGVGMLIYYNVRDNR